MQNRVFQPGIGPIRVPHCLSSDPSAVLWGELPCAADGPVLTINSGDSAPIVTSVTSVTIGLEGIHEDLDEAVRTCVPRPPSCRPNFHATPHTPRRIPARRRTSTFRRSWTP